MKHANYSVRSVSDGLITNFHQYLRASYHIWDEMLIAERDRILQQPFVTHQEPYLEATPVYASGQRYEELGISSAAASVLIATSLSSGSGIPAIPYAHQAEALHRGSVARSDLIVATGTGSGKTECFLMPILANMVDEASTRAKSWEGRGVRALLLYPMNALVNDQLGRLRRLLGTTAVREAFKNPGGRNATFGMYTGRTPYPGEASTQKDKRQVADVIHRLYVDGMTDGLRARLQEEGKWPAKDLERFVRDGLTTHAQDVEMLTRQEMQASAPDLLVTNYSMLEYMMLRPIEAPIFEQTRDWLRSDARNKFTIVLDEAHMYRGSGGAEVAYLLRRIQSRLDVPRERIQYILTSASLGSSRSAENEVLEFAAKLTGGHSASFSLIKSKLQERIGGRSATSEEAKALAAFNLACLQGNENGERDIATELEKLAASLGTVLAVPETSEHALRNYAFQILESLETSFFVATCLTEQTLTLAELTAAAFPDFACGGDATEALLALMAFARQSGSLRPFCSIRAHFFFRGLPGLFVCVNKNCHERLSAGGPMASLGRMHTVPQLTCACGARIYELLTHRSCGAAYLRAYTQGDDGDFLWHQPSKGVWTNAELREGQFYVVPDDLAGQGNGRDPKIWLHIYTGQIRNSQPQPEDSEKYIELLRPSKETKDRGRKVQSVERCPACRQATRADAPTAMDLATKGEAPFAHLVRTQVALQPASSKATAQAPNAGRKTIIFSDGRQKAARLARDIPREIELDVFRQALFLAASELADIKREARLDGWLYAAFLKVVSDHNLTFFDGDDRAKLEKHIKEFHVFCDGRIEDALDHFDQRPAAYSALLLKQLCTTHYSVSALTLGFVAPTVRALRAINDELKQLSTEEQLQVAVAWVQRLLSRHGFHADLGEGVRRKASPYPHQPTKAALVFSDVQAGILTARGIDPNAISERLASLLAEEGKTGGTYLNPKKIVLQSALDRPWAQCEECKIVSPLLLLGLCANCGGSKAALVHPEQTKYLRARKGFWRDPVARVVNRIEQPMSIDVQEHSAQLSYKDEVTPTPTTEEFERRFRDVLKPGERAVDVLSCTTTMEVGIDIGSLIAVSMRNVPPMRQNYQQRAGRAGRRGSAVSTVLTYAQVGAHDAYYFANPKLILAGDAPRPVLDTANRQIAERHAYAQLLQDFFRPLAASRASATIFTALGDTWQFFHSDLPASLAAFERWIDSDDGHRSLAKAQAWLPIGLAAPALAAEFMRKLRARTPTSQDRLETSLLEFLFGLGILPSYAFPRDLCALQIQEQIAGRRGDFRVVEQAQQAMNVALSEYAPGRLVVVNKKTYRIGTVTANSTDAEIDRGAALFGSARAYRHCTECSYTAGFGDFDESSDQCPQCNQASLRTMTVIRPEVVYPRGRSEIDEFDDEQVYSQVTQAQLPLPEAGKQIPLEKFGSCGHLASQRSQSLVMVNKGDPGADEDGFRVCDQCGKVQLEGDRAGPHERDYYTRWLKGNPGKCSGEFQQVFLGYSFVSDVLLLRIRLATPLRFSTSSTRLRRPLEDALQSLCEGLVLSIARKLDIDAREVSAGYRFGTDDQGAFADIFVYDTLSGGAGYALEAQRNFDEIFVEAVRSLNECECHSSCEKCLRHYGNRFFHASLDRHLASVLASYVLTGKAPQPLSGEESRRTLAPLAELLELAGWTLSPSEEGWKAEAHGKSLQLRASPSLRESPLRTKEGGVPTFYFTPYELDRDLPSAYAELV